jgi:glycerophosphoryl diester phosphodiesterase
LAGFRRAAEFGCRWVEFDVRLSSDGHPIVFHDKTLLRMTGETGEVSAMPLSALLKCKVAGAPIPTLESALAELSALGLGANLEMKAEAGEEAALAESVAQAVARGPPLPLLVSSFSLPALAALYRVAPELPRGVLMERLMTNWRDAPQRLGAAALICDHQTLHRATVRAAVQGADFFLATYTVNDPDRARELFAWGVDSVISDVPDAIMAHQSD